MVSSVTNLIRLRFGYSLLECAEIMREKLMKWKDK